MATNPKPKPARNNRRVWILAAVLAIGLLIALWPKPNPRVFVHSDRSLRTGLLKQIGFALNQYHKEFGSFPPAFTTTDGVPMHSWRVLLLPKLGYQHIYDKYRFDEPWDSEENRKLLAQYPSVYKVTLQNSSNLANPGSTNVLAVVGPWTAFPGEKPARKRDIKDKRTAIVVENFTQEIPWTAPLDISPQEYVLRSKFRPEGNNTSGIPAHPPHQMVLLEDGQPRYITEREARFWLDLFNRADGRALGSF